MSIQPDPGEPYQSLERIRARIEHDPNDLFNDNSEKRFDRLIMGTEAVGDDALDAGGWAGLEYESRRIIENHTSDEPFSLEEDRVDTLRAHYTETLSLVYPVIDVSQVEVKRTLRDDWEVFDEHRWDATEHALVLEYASRNSRSHVGGTRRNTLADEATSAEWADVATKVRVTYDRGFDPVPGDVLNIQIDLINRMLRTLKQEQSIAAASPEDFQGVAPDFDTVLTEDLIERLESITALGSSVKSI